MNFKYKESKVGGKSWIRAANVIVYNELDEVPRVSFGEQKVVDVDGQILSRDLGTLNVLITPEVIGEAFAILDENGNPTEETATVADLAGLLTSAYVHFANKRDSEEADRLAELERLRLEAQEKLEEETEVTPEDDE